MTNEEFIKKTGEYFNVMEHEDCVELETWTKGGVNMIIVLHKENGLYIDQFNEYRENFDVDEEIDVYRQDQHYKDSFTIRQSLEDFEAFEKWLNEIEL